MTSRYKTYNAMIEKGLIKESTGIRTPDVDAAISAAKAAVGPLLAGVTILGGASLLGDASDAALAAIREKMGRTAVLKNIKAIELSLDKSPNFKTREEKDKAKARLYEIARIAPHVTMHVPLVTGLITSKLHSGLSEDDRMHLATLQAQYYPKPNVSGFMPKLGSEAVGRILADVSMIKQAALPEAVRWAAALAGVSLGASLIGGAINAGASYVKQRNLKEALEMSFKKAISLSDSDKEPLSQNRDKARQAFGTLAHFAPHAALDPQVARSFMNKIVSYDQGVDVSSAKELSEITRNMYKKETSPFAAGFGNVAQVTSLPKFVTHGIESLEPNTTGVTP